MNKFIVASIACLLISGCHKHKPFTQTKLYGQTPIVIEQNYSSDSTSIVYTSRIEVVPKNGE